MAGRRRPWVTSSLALVLGVVGFGLMFTSDATDDYSGWPLVITATQLLWLWTVDLEGRAQAHDPASRRMSITARITASLLLALAGGVISAAPLYALVDMAALAAIPDGWDALLAGVVLATLPIASLCWGLWAWLVSKRRAPRAAARSMLALVTLFSLPALGLGWIAHRMSRHSDEMLGGLLSWFALVGALVVLAWTSVPWLELYLSGRARARDAGAAQTTPTTKF